MLELFKGLQFKRDPRLIVFAIVLVIVTGLGVWQHFLTAKEGVVFLSGALALPGLFGAKGDDEPPPPKGPTVLPTNVIGGMLSVVVSIIVATVLTIAISIGLARMVATTSSLPEPPITSVVTGCGMTKQEAKDVTKKTLSVLELACIFASTLTDESAVADACGIAKDLTPLIRNLVGQREGAKRSGVMWPVEDAGASLHAPVDAGRDGSR